MNSNLAEQLFPNGDAIGMRIRFGFMPDYENIEIVGIARNARIFDIRDATTPVLFLSSLQYPSEWGGLLVRTKESPEALEKAISHEVESLGHEYVIRTRTVAQTIDAELVEERVTAMLSGFFAALALLLASIGLYGLMSYTVTRRTREIGIRVAVGAHRQNVLWLVLRETLALALFVVGEMLFGLSPSDLPTITVVSLLLLLVALFAGYLPAHRASAIDPIVALRTE